MNRRSIMRYLVLLCLLVFISPTLAQNSLPSLLFDANCQRACFLKIEPSRTSEVQLIDMLERNSISYVRDEISPSHIYFYSFQYTHPLLSQKTQAVDVWVRDGIVYSIRLVLNNYTLNDLISDYSIPSYMGDSADGQTLVYNQWCKS